MFYLCKNWDDHQSCPKSRKVSQRIKICLSHSIIDFACGVTACKRVSFLSISGLSSSYAECFSLPQVNGHTFQGYGSSKDQAKQAAAEAALMSFVKPPPRKPPAGEAPKPEDDATPWKTLASFAMYKLFTDWRDNKFGPGPHGYPPMPSMSELNNSNILWILF